jgi:hypothetical protein
MKSFAAEPPAPADRVRHETLSTALQRGAAELVSTPVPAAVQRAMWQAYEAREPQPEVQPSPALQTVRAGAGGDPDLSRRPAWPWLAGLTVGVALVWGLARVGLGLPGAPGLPPTALGAVAAPDAVAAGFLPLVSPQRMQALASQPSAAWVLPAELPRERLAAFGLPFDPARASEPVQAELLVHPSGELLAVRVVWKP